MISFGICSEMTQHPKGLPLAFFRRPLSCFYDLFFNSLQIIGQNEDYLEIRSTTSFKAIEEDLYSDLNKRFATFL